jgi:hypothetical protein
MDGHDIFAIRVNNHVWCDLEELVDDSGLNDVPVFVGKPIQIAVSNGLSLFFPHSLSLCFLGRLVALVYLCIAYAVVGRSRVGRGHRHCGCKFH